MNTIWVTHRHKHNSRSLVSAGATSSGDNTYPKHFDCWPLFGSLTSICIRKLSVALCNQTFYIMFLQWCAWMIVQCNKPKQVCASFRAQGRERLTEAQMWAKQLRLRLTDLTKNPMRFGEEWGSPWSVWPVFSKPHPTKRFDIFCSLQVCSAVELKHGRKKISSAQGFLPCLPCSSWTIDVSQVQKANFQPSKAKFPARKTN